MSVSKLVTTAVVIAGVSVVAGTSKLALAQQRRTLGDLTSGEGIFVDGKTFNIARGKAKGDPAAQIAKLGAKEVGPGAIIFRYGDKLYMVEGPRGGAAGDEELPGQLGRVLHEIHEGLSGQLGHVLHEELPGQLERFVHE